MRIRVSGKRAKTLPPSRYRDRKRRCIPVRGFPTAKNTLPFSQAEEVGKVCNGVPDCQRRLHRSWIGARHSSMAACGIDKEIRESHIRGKQHGKYGAYGDRDPTGAFFCFQKERGTDDPGNGETKQYRGDPEWHKQYILSQKIIAKTALFHRYGRETAAFLLRL